MAKLELAGAKSGASQKTLQSSQGAGWLAWVRHVHLGLRMRLDILASGTAVRHLLGGPGLILAVLLLPAMLFAVVAWQDRISEENQTEQVVRSTVRIFEEDARGILQTYQLTANMVNDHIRGLSWQEIATSQALHEYLADVIHNDPQIQSLWLINSSGLVRNSSAVFPTSSVRVTDRDYFIALREHDSGLFVGQLTHGRVLKEDIFNVAVRRSSASGSFDGVVVVSASPSYFTNVWYRAGRQPGDAAALIRGDGAIIARQPDAVDADTPPLPATSQLMQAMAGTPSGFIRGVSTISGDERFYGFQKLSGFPVYAGYGISVKDVLRTWHEHLLFYFEFFGVATLALVLMAHVATRRARRETAALHAWRETAQRLHEEAEHRAAVQGQLLQAQKMEALGQITSGIAHDLGNVLQTIIFSLEWLKEHATPRDERHLAAAMAAASRGSKALESMLSFARLRPHRPEVFDLNATLRSMDSLLHQTLGSGTALHIVPAVEPCWIITDRNETELAILNLAVNARDAMPDGGTLTVTTAAVRLAGEPDGLAGDFVALTVKDTGTGMPPVVQAKVFEPFFTTKEPGKGTGLGLSMVHGFTKQSHGTVTIDTTAGQGTSVVLYLPRCTSDGDGVMIKQTETKQTEDAASS